MIRRRFVEVSFGQMHVREREGMDTPLMMLHAAPGSALMLGPLQRRLRSPTFALDLPGMGDSDSLPAGNVEPNGEIYTAAVLEAIAALGLEEVDVYGTLSGVRVALALAHTSRVKVRRVILDGIGIPKAEELPDLLENYAPAFDVDINGTHLQTIFQLCRDQYLFYPWNMRDAAHRRPTGLPSAAALHTKALEAIKSMNGFRPLIRAAFRYPVKEQLATLSQPALISADGSAIRPDLPLLTEPPAEPLTAGNENLDARAAQINAFLGH
jgi:pimeloyl-ACP methyl ester carboxylesterase